MNQIFKDIRNRVHELRMNPPLSLLDIETMIAREFNISFTAAVENITLCALADSFLA